MLETILLALENNLYNIIVYLPKLLGGLAVFFVGFKLEPIVRKSIRLALDRSSADPSLTKFAYSFARMGYKLMLIIIALSVADFQTTSLVAALGAAGFAVGLALQGSMSNFASGILILSLKPIKVGEIIEVGTKTGTVQKIEMFTTTLLTEENTTVIIPNSQITSQVVTNLSRPKKQ